MILKKYNASKARLLLRIPNNITKYLVFRTPIISIISIQQLHLVSQSGIIIIIVITASCFLFAGAFTIILIKL